MLLSLPSELQRQCIEKLDVENLKALRLATKSILELSTAILFQTVNLKHSDESADKFFSIHKNRRLRSYVRRITLNTSDDPYEVEDRERDEAEVLTSFLDAISALKEFQDLREVEIRFAIPCAGPDDVVCK